MLELVASSDFSFEKGGRILDFGCAAGRMLRWLKPLTSKVEVWSCDVHAESIEWCRSALVPPFHFCKTSVLPEIPFETGFFNLVYAGSVFTHLEEAAPWLASLPYAA